MPASVLRFKSRRELDEEKRQSLVRRLRRQLRANERERNALEAALIGANEPPERRYDRLVERVARSQLELNEVQTILDKEPGGSAGRGR